MNPTLKDRLRPYWYAYNRALIPLKQWRVKPLTWISASSLELGPPHGFYPTTREWYDRLNGEDKAKSAYQEIHPASTSQRTLPQTLSGETHWKFKQRATHQAEATFVAQIPQGRVFGENGTVLTPCDSILADVSTEHRRTIEEHSLFTLWKLPPVRHLAGTAAVLSTQGSDVYFHWMFDVLPRLELLRLAGIDFNNIDYFIFSSYHLPFQIQTLEKLGIPANKIITNREFPHISADTLIVPSWASQPGDMPEWACQFLKNTFLPDKTNHSSEPSRKLYISRAQARHRKVINEEELVEKLETIGFESIILESKSMEEQAQLFASASHIIAPHGGGQSNLVFCHPGTKVLEIFSPNYVETHYWVLSNEVNIDYHYLMGAGKIPDDYYDPHWIWDNLEVPISPLYRYLQASQTPTHLPKSR